MNKLITEELLLRLEDRFAKNMKRHNGLKWEEVALKLGNHPAKLASLLQMEETGGEPDVVVLDENSSEYSFVDCSSESPSGRRNFCYDAAALNERKTFKPASSAIAEALRMGIELLSEAEYRKLQTYGEFDTKTSSWLLTPTEIRKLGGAIFGDRRYNSVFVYHNGASSYYASRGFRGLLRV